MVYVDGDKKSFLAIPFSGGLSCVLQLYDLIYEKNTDESQKNRHNLYEKYLGIFFHTSVMGHIKRGVSVASCARLLSRRPDQVQDMPFLGQSPAVP